MIGTEHEPEPRTVMLRLIDDAIGTSALCASYDDESDRERFEVEKARLAATRAEIVRRLALIDSYRGTEASNIKAILATGRPLDGWISEEIKDPTDPHGFAIAEYVVRGGDPNDVMTRRQLDRRNAMEAIPELVTLDECGEEPYPYGWCRVHQSQEGMCDTSNGIPCAAS